MKRKIKIKIKIKIKKNGHWARTRARGRGKGSGKLKPINTQRQTAKNVIPPQSACRKLTMSVN